MAILNIKIEKSYTIDYIIENNIDKEYYGFVYITECVTNGKMYIGQRKFYGIMVGNWIYCVSHSDYKLNQKLAYNDYIKMMEVYDEN